MPNGECGKLKRLQLMARLLSFARRRIYLVLNMKAFNRLSGTPETSYMLLQRGNDICMFSGPLMKAIPGDI